jgi:hypothetical protein
MYTGELAAVSTSTRALDSVVAIASRFAQRSRNNSAGWDANNFSVATSAALTAVLVAAMDPMDTTERANARLAFQSFIYAGQKALQPAAALRAIYAQRILQGTGPLWEVIQFLGTVLAGTIGVTGH